MKQAASLLFSEVSGQAKQLLMEERRNLFVKGPTKPKIKPMQSHRTMELALKLLVGVTCRVTGSSP